MMEYVFLFLCPYIQVLDFSWNGGHLSSLFPVSTQGSYIQYIGTRLITIPSPS